MIGTCWQSDGSFRNCCMFSISRALAWRVPTPTESACRRLTSVDLSVAMRSMRAAAGGIGCSCRGVRSELICVRASSAALQVLIIFSRSSMSSRSILSRNWLSFIPNTTQSRIRLSIDAGRSQCRAFDRRSVMNSSNGSPARLSTREQSVSLHCYVLLWYTVCFELFLQLFQFLSIFFSVEREGVAYLVSSASNEMEECCRLHRVVFVDEACGRGVDVESLLKTFPC